MPAQADSAAAMAQRAAKPFRGTRGILDEPQGRRALKAHEGRTGETGGRVNLFPAAAEEVRDPPCGHACGLIPISPPQPA